MVTLWPVCLLLKHRDGQLQKWKMSRCIQNVTLCGELVSFLQWKRKSGATILPSKTESVLKEDPMNLSLSNLDTCIPAYTLLCSDDGWHYSPFQSDCGNGNDRFEVEGEQMTPLITSDWWLVVRPKSLSYFNLYEWCLSFVRDNGKKSLVFLCLSIDSKHLLLLTQGKTERERKRGMEKWQEDC